MRVNYSNYSTLIITHTHTCMLSDARESLQMKLSGVFDSQRSSSERLTRSGFDHNASETHTHTHSVSSVLSL